MAHKDEKGVFVPHDGPVGLGETVPVAPAPSQDDTRKAKEDDFLLAREAVDTFRALGFAILEGYEGKGGEYMAGARASIGFVLGHLEDCVKKYQ